MSTRSITFLLACALIAAVPAAFGDPIIVNANFGAVPVACGIGFGYQGTGDCDNQWAQDFNSDPRFGWTLSTSHDQDWYGPGVTLPGSYFGPPSFDGMPFTQAAFLQSGGGITSSVSQDIDGFAPGDYVVHFYLGSRTWYDNGATVEALLDGQVIGTWVMGPAVPFTLESAWFNVSTGGVHTLEFLNPQDVDDNTAFLSGVSIYAVPAPASLVLLATGLLGGLAKFYRR
jgi:hypothetical protein